MVMFVSMNAVNISAVQHTNTLWSELGKFYSHVRTETLVCHRGIRAPQQPTGGPLDRICLNIQAGGGGESASCRPQRLTSTSKGSMGVVPCDCNRKPWSVIPGTEFHAKTEVTSEGKLDVEDVDRGETYLRTRGLHTRDKTTRFIKSGH